jgi:hypothetical protein
VTQEIRLEIGDCVERMRDLLAGSIGSIICDPPYGIEFMGKDFDKLGDGEAQQLWHLEWLKEAYRVLAPGGTIKAFSGTRTFHRLATAMELAGFTGIRLEAWVYGSGFPKSLDVSKAIDKAAGAEREVVGTKSVSRLLPNDVPFGQGLISKGPVVAGTVEVTAPTTSDAKKWAGWGTALKPAWEPFVVAEKAEPR